jgi:molecular chaperone GrpE
MTDDVVKGMEGAEPEVPEEAAQEAPAAEPETPEGVAQEAPAAEPPPEEAPVDLQAELDKAKADAEEYLDQWRRTAAEFSNYRKRVDREREEAGRFANALLLTRLLPILDDLERAMATLPPDLSRFSWIEGVSLIQRKLEFTLEAEGLKRIEAAGKPFDPMRHQAVIREETDAYPDGQVIADLQYGYELHGRVLRPSLVKVAVAATPPPAEEAPESAAAVADGEEGAEGATQCEGGES